MNFNKWYKKVILSDISLEKILNSNYGKIHIFVLINSCKKCHRNRSEVSPKTRAVYSYLSNQPPGPPVRLFASLLLRKMKNTYFKLQQNMDLHQKSLKFRVTHANLSSNISEDATVALQ